MISSIDAHIPFCDEWLSAGWNTRARPEQEAYVMAELHRVSSEGAPLLRAVLGCTDEWAKFMALKFLVDKGNSAGESAPDYESVYLRLVEPERLDYEHPITGDTEVGAALPPTKDPQGRMLPKAKQGNTLVVKLGNKGGKLDTSEAQAAMQFGGDSRANSVRIGRDIYDVAEITRLPKLFSLRSAVIILSQWGYGVTEAPFRALRGEHKGERKRGQCTWLVEEVNPDDAMQLIMEVRRAKATEAMLESPPKAPAPTTAPKAGK